MAKKNMEAQAAEPVPEEGVQVLAADALDEQAVAEQVVTGEEYNPMQELMDLCAETGLPFAYGHFAEGESPDPPFITFLIPASDNFSADGRVYLKVDVVHIELYTDEKNPETERMVEAVLDAHDIFYDKTEVWIGSEKLYEVLYSFERKADDGE